MPRGPIKRGSVYWIIETVAGQRIRQSLGTSDPTIAAEIYAHTLKRVWERHHYGTENVLTFADAISFYDAKPAEAKYLLRLLPRIGNMRVRDIRPGTVRDLAKEVYPDAATDTWRRQVIAPVRAVINAAADRGHCAPIRIKAYTERERIAQDRERGKRSRPSKRASDAAWITAFREACTLPHLSAFATFMFATGARVSQVVALTPDDFAADCTRAHLPAAKGHDATWVEIPAFLAREIAALEPRHGRVFGYVRRTSMQSAWYSTIKRAGIERLSMHEAGRHGFGTAMMRSGIDPATAAKLGRWSSTKIYLETYAHGDDAIKAKDVIDTYLTQAAPRKAQDIDK